jgi:hypothetical protein
MALLLALVLGLRSLEQVAEVVALKEGTQEESERPVDLVVEERDKDLQ